MDIRSDLRHATDRRDLLCAVAAAVMAVAPLAATGRRAFAASASPPTAAPRSDAGYLAVPNTDEPPRSDAWQTAVAVLQEARPPSIPAGAEVTTLLVTFPPGDPGSPPHRHSGPAFGYVLAGEMRLELEGEPERVVRAGEAFWEPGGDLIHYRDGNNRADARLRFVVTQLCPPGQPLLTPVGKEELAQRRHLRAPRPS
jgi:quercetin dioxygenase-like cupin family protein